MRTKRLRWSGETKFTVIIFLIVIFVYLLYRFRTIITPLILACILAYILNPIVNYIQKKTRLPRILAILLTYLIFILFIAAIISSAIPLVINQFQGFSLDLQDVIRQIGLFFRGEIIFFGIVIDGTAIADRLINSLEQALEPAFSQTFRTATAVFESFIWIIFILIVSVYLIKDVQKMIEYFKGLLPPDNSDEWLNIAKEINIVWGAFFRGQLLLSIIVMGIVTMISFIVGLPFALVFGILAGFLEFIPSVGHGIWLVLASLVGFFVGSTWLQIPNWVFLLIIIAVHTIFTQFDLNYLIPRVIGSSLHLHPLVVILGIVAGAAFAGVLGVVLAAPTIASMRVIARYIYKRLFDQEMYQNQFPD